jgi:hypothetical protein
MRYLFGEDELVANFVAQMIPHVGARGFGKCRAIGVVDARDELIAGIVYHSFVPEQGVIEMSAAALPGCRWLTPTTLKVMYQFPFLQCGCQMVVMRTRADNEHILRQLAAFNYMLIPVPRLYGRHADGVVCLLTDDDWAANKICQKYRHHVADAQFEEAA